MLNIGLRSTRVWARVRFFYRFKSWRTVQHAFRKRSPPRMCIGIWSSFEYLVPTASVGGCAGLSRRMTSIFFSLEIDVSFPLQLSLFSVFILSWGRTHSMNNSSPPLLILRFFSFSCSNSSLCFTSSEWFAILFVSWIAPNFWATLDLVSVTRCIDWFVFVCDLASGPCWSPEKVQPAFIKYLLFQIKLVNLKVTDFNALCSHLPFIDNWSK